jgi:hypothetical protein
MSSTRTGTATANPASNDLFFSERSALKLAVNEQTEGLTYSEEEAKEQGGEFGTIGSKSSKSSKSSSKKSSKKSGFGLIDIQIPNTIETGENSAGKYLEASAIVIDGHLGQQGERDMYRLKLDAGQFFNAEVISISMRDIQNQTITSIALYSEAENGELTLITENYQTMEVPDPLLFDVEISTTGYYIIEVYSDLFCVEAELDCPPGNSDCDEEEESYFCAGEAATVESCCFHLGDIPTGNEEVDQYGPEYLLGDYQLFAYSVDNPLFGVEGTGFSFTSAIDIT